MKKKIRRNYRKGGPVKGPGTSTSDQIPALLSNGEYVLPAEAVAAIGVPTLEAIRRGGLLQRNLPSIARAATNGAVNQLGVAPGIGGFVQGMTYSPDANAPVMDRLATQEYQQAQAATQAGQGQQYPYPPIFGLIGPAPERPADTMARMEAEQWRADQGGAMNTPTAQRKLAEANRYNPQAGLPRFASGGMVLGLDEEWARPSSESALGAWWRGSDAYKNLNKYGADRGVIPQGAPRPPQKNPLDFLGPKAPTVPGQPTSSAPTGPYQDPRDYAAGNPGITGKAMTATGATQVPGTDTYVRDLPFGAGGTTEYTHLGKSGIGTATFQGLAKPGGFLGYAGTPETKGMTQEQATAYNVGNLNRQIEAQRSLREAQNPGITTGQAGRAFGDVVSFGTPGGLYGDEQMQAQKRQGMLDNAARPGIGRNRRQALLQAAGQMAAMPESPSVKRLQETPAPGIDPYQLGKLQIDQQRLGIDQQRLGLDQAKAQQEAGAKNLQYELDAFTKLPKVDQETRLSQLQAKYLEESQKNGNASPEAKRLAGILNLFGRVRPELDLMALIQQQQQK